MKKRKEPFTDPAKLNELNEEVWRILGEGHGTPEQTTSDSDGTALPGPGELAGDEAANPPPIA